MNPVGCCQSRRKQADANDECYMDKFMHCEPHFPSDNDPEPYLEWSKTQGRHTESNVPGLSFIDGELSLRNPYIRHEIEGLTEGPGTFDSVCRPCVFDHSKYG